MTSTIKKTTLKTSDNATLVSYPLSDGSTVYDVVLYPHTMDETTFHCDLAAYVTIFFKRHSRRTCCWYTTGEKSSSRESD